MMKKFFYVGIIATVLLSGCSNSDTPGLPTGSSTTTSGQTINTSESEQQKTLEAELPDDPDDEIIVQTEDTTESEQPKTLETGLLDNPDDEIIVQTEDTTTIDDKLLATVLPLPSKYSQNEADLLSTDFSFTETEKGTDVFAVGNGEIIGAGWFAGYGRTVIIRHSDRISLYCHLDDYTVNTGDTVSAGDLIGHTGSTGETTKVGLGYRVLTDEYLSDTMDEFVHGL